MKYLITFFFLLFSLRIAEGAYDRHDGSQYSCYEIANDRDAVTDGKDKAFFSAEYEIYCRQWEDKGTRLDKAVIDYMRAHDGN